MSEKRLNEELAAVEAALGSLQPKSTALDRDRLMFLAGRAAAERKPTAWLWPLATAATTLVAITFGTMLATRDGPQVVERVVYVRPTQQADKPPATSAELRTDYLKLRRLVLLQGVDAMPEPVFQAELAIPTLGNRNGRTIERLIDG